MIETVDYELNLLRSGIVPVADFPAPGILFRDVTPLLSQPGMLSLAVRRMLVPWRGAGCSFAGVESRGFVFAAAMAAEEHSGLHLLRKSGKLPPPVTRCEYALEYGSAALELRGGIVARGERVLLVDDVLATGGTAAAAVELLRSAGAEVLGAAFLMELGGLRGREALADVGCTVTAVLRY